MKAQLARARLVFVSAALFVALLPAMSSTVVAQEKESPKASPAKPSGLVLEINTKQGPIHYLWVPGTSSGGRYRRLDGWKPAPDARPQQPPQPTFEVISRLENVEGAAAVRVEVNALWGRFYDERTPVGSFLLREGERAGVEEMRKYGFEPMELSVARLKDAPSFVLPVAESLVPSVGVAGVEPTQNTNYPSYRVTLRNQSHKDITYLQINTFRNNKISVTKWPSGEHNRPLMKAGETYVETLPASTGTKDADGYSTSPPERIEIIAVVFADKSYEGDKKSAVLQLSRLKGEQVQLARALALLQQAASTQAAGEGAALEALKAQAGALGREAQLSALEELARELGADAPPTPQAAKQWVESGMNWVRRDLLAELDRYARRRAEGSTAPFNAWLEELRHKYQAWHARL